MTDAKTPKPAQPGEKYVVRFPDGMRDRIADAAKESGRSMNAEIVKRLEDSFMLAPELDAPRAQLALVLDSSGYPISWGEILTHVSAMREAAGLDELASMNTYVVTPELISTSKRLQQIPKLMEYYERAKKLVLKKPRK